MIRRWYYPGSRPEREAFLEWDDDIQVGDLVTTYYKGYHVVTDVQPNAAIPGYPDTISFTQLLTEDGKDSPKRKRDCSASYVKVVTKDIAQQEYQAAVDVATAKHKALLELINLR